MTKDARKIGRAGKLAIRKLVIGKRMEGESVKLISESLGISPKVIYKWLRLNKKRGEVGLIPKSPPGRPSLLSAKQKKVKEFIIGKEPRQYGF